MASAADSQCIECLRRQLPCDATKPVCHRCRAAGIVCPGYGDAKPLVWLAPGKVRIRNRAKKDASAAAAGNTAAAASSSSSTSPVPDAGVRIKTEPAEATVRSFTFHNADQKKMKSSSARKKRQGGEKAVQVSQRQPGAAEMPGPGTVMRFSTPSIRPPILGSRPTELNRAWCDIMAASEYHNRYIYPEVVENQLAPTPFIAPMGITRPHSASTHHGLVAIILQHELVKASHSGDASALSMDGMASMDLDKKWQRVHYHTGAAIRALQDALTNKETQLTDETISSVILVLFVVLHQSVLPNWKPHMAGIMTMIHMRGGIGELLSIGPPMVKVILLSLIIVCVIGNTTSPAAEQLATQEYFHQRDAIFTLYEKFIYPQLPCPGTLFCEIIHINHLRHQLATNVPATERDAVGALLSRIAAFDPTAWAQAKGLHQRSEVIRVAKIFRISVLLYAMNSLPWPADTPPPTPPDGQYYPTKAECRDELFELLEDNFESPVILKCSLWPLIVAGVEAAGGAATERRFVAACLSDLSERTGVPPRTAKIVLERIWVSGETSWDKCFSEPFLILV